MIILKQLTLFIVRHKVQGILATLNFLERYSFIMGKKEKKNVFYD